ncbi:DUF1246 domain-containing protein [Thermococcus peptonophilus]|uniref:DUF1246 domain-containing protein n=1 Tax=Thermococcus peptonophilus TaxID=53952 RepID=UPI0034670BC4
MPLLAPDTPGGAKKEGFKTRLYVSPKRRLFYSSLPVVDELLVTDDMSAILSDDGIVVPHGSFVAYLGLEAIENAKAKFFGNRRFLKWETTFELQDRASIGPEFRGLGGWLSQRTLSRMSSTSSGSRGGRGGEEAATS